MLSLPKGGQLLSVRPRLKKNDMPAQRPFLRIVSGNLGRPVPLLLFTRVTLFTMEELEVKQSTSAS